MNHEAFVQSRLDLVVRSTEIDVNGHVNNAKYLEYLEWGREDFYEQGSLPYDVLLGLGLITVTANININYRKEAKQNDLLTVITRPGRIGNTSFTLEQTIINTTMDLLVADASVTLVMVDATTRKAVPVPNVIRTFFV
ncbi:MAG: thioesterase family protein [Acidibacillus sp.]|uniref:Long-chain acyl-CoA thioesterase FadM n=1 Tax=Sulfoacidibacillus ferrooxidans TaxID=2005001 RepID=A0A9X1V780_9BACL|nr:Long-chain acyl-CoA thioesterase FadM [Sulfoacidibacillus ferrooxidans]MCY0893289.1 thioesterase family protein [Acidibacillus sp.]